MMDSLAVADSKLHRVSLSLFRLSPKATGIYTSALGFRFPELSESEYMRMVNRRLQTV